MAEEYARLVAQSAVAQLCDSFGFVSVQRSALDALTDILCRYIQSLGRSAHELAESCGRTEANLQDLLLALEDVGTSFQDVVKFVEFVEETGPAQPAPTFPVPKPLRDTTTPSFLQRGESPPSAEVPEWLPIFPDQHTYVSTPVWEESSRTPLSALKEEGKQRRKAEESLVRIYNRMEALTAGGYQGGTLWGEQPGAETPPEPSPQEQPDSKTAGVVEGRAEQGPVSVPSLAEAFFPVLGMGRPGPTEGKTAEAEARASRGAPEMRSAETKWTGWSVPVKDAGTGLATPKEGGGRVAFDLASPWKRKALAVRCRVAVKPQDLLSGGGRGGEGRGRGGREGEGEEKRRKVEQMLSDAETAD